MKLFGHEFGHKTNPNRKPFDGVRPTTDKEVEQASEAAFERLEQEERLGRVTVHGVLSSVEGTDGVEQYSNNDLNSQ